MARAFQAVGLVVAAGLVAGCGEPVAKFEGPTVNEFVGKLVHEGKPVSFPAEEKVTLQAFHEKGQQFVIPIQSDGSFKIGWMPIGKYSPTLTRLKASAKGGAPSTYALPPGALAIVDGKTQYDIELGKSYKP